MTTAQLVFRTTLESTKNMPVQPCPDTQECDLFAVYAEKHGVYTKILLVFAVAIVVVFGAYLKLRLSFSSYTSAIFLGIPFHLFAGLLLLFVSMMASEGLLRIDAFRSMIGMCKKTEGHDDDGTCVPLCQNRKKVPVADWLHPTYECIDPNPKTILWYDGFIFRKLQDESRPLFAIFSEVLPYLYS